MDPHSSDSEPQAEPVARAGSGSGPLVLAISSNTMGRGDDELGQVLMRSHLHTLTEVTPRPDTLIFFNAGVMLATEGSPVLDDLEVLIEKGAQILLCGTCLSHFGLKERVAVGEISNMYAITETMMRAGKVVNL
ncbi:MAG: sulfurtransferase-like selenium metabolism protein YedF [Thermoleophilia bacterium]|nr:sulfurtransferase-like selenium metabolism protein YedF [Thermoleophilia bacterium]